MQKQAKSHTRSIRAISKAENEFLDRVWYERKLVLLQKLKSGEEKIDPNIKKGMLACMKRTKTKYGGKKNTPKLPQRCFRVGYDKWETVCTSLSSW